MAHTTRCEESISPARTCRCSCGGALHGRRRGIGAARVLAEHQRGRTDDGTTPRRRAPSETAVHSAEWQLRARASALGDPVEDGTFDWLLGNADVYEAVADLAITAAEEAIGRPGHQDGDAEPGQERARPCGPYSVCQLLADLARAVDLAIADAAGAASAVVDDIIPDDWDDREEVVEAAREVVSALLSHTIGVAAGLQAVRLAASIGAVTFCPNVDAHAAVRECGNPLVEEVRDEAVDRIAAALREAAPGLAA